MPDLEEQLKRHLHKPPTLGQGTFIATGAVVIGDVTLGDHSSVWYNAVLRGDINRIVVGHHTNIQDNAVLHLADEFPCLVGNYVTVGHAAILHACTVKDEVLVGMRANALITQGMEIPPGSLVLGSPATVVRPLTAKERSDLRGWAEKYADYAAHCLAHGIGVRRSEVPGARHLPVPQLGGAVEGMPRPGGGAGSSLGAYISPS